MRRFSLRLEGLKFSFKNKSWNSVCIYVEFPTISEQVYSICGCANHVHYMYNLLPCTVSVTWLHTPCRFGILELIFKILMGRIERSNYDH